MIRRPPRSTLFPYRRSSDLHAALRHEVRKLGLRPRIERGELLRQGCPGGGAHGRVLLLNQLARLEGPRHELAVQENPVRLELVPETGPARGGAQPLHKSSFKRRVAEEWPPRSCVDDPAGGGLHTESPFGRDGISAQ